MNEHIFAHWLLSNTVVACGYTRRANANPNIEFVTCPKCRAVWQELIDKITATEPTKHKRG